MVTDSLQDGIIHGDEAIQNIGTIEHWKRGPLLGRGSFGKVYEALDLATGRVMAVKQVKTVTDRRSDQQQAHGHARQTQAEQAMKLGLVALDEAGDGVNAAEKKPVVELTPDAKEVEALETEIALLRTLNHPNIVRIGPWQSIRDLIRCALAGLLPCCLGVRTESITSTVDVVGCACPEQGPSTTPARSQHNTCKHLHVDIVPYLWL